MNQELSDLKWGLDKISDFITYAILFPERAIKTKIEVHYHSKDTLSEQKRA